MVKGKGRGGAGHGERRCIYQRGRERGRLGCAEEEEVEGEVGGRGGDCAPIHIGGIWLENELFLFLRGVREVFLRRVGQKRSQTSRRAGTE